MAPIVCIGPHTVVLCAVVQVRKDPEQRLEVNVDDLLVDDLGERLDALLLL
jgi:hypothetical protein